MVRSALVSLLALAVALAIPGVASAAVYTTPLVDLNDTTNYVDQSFSAGMSETVASRAQVTGPAGPTGDQWIRYTLATTGAAGESKAGIGDNFAIAISSLSPLVSAGMADLEGFGSYALAFHNPNAGRIDVNPFINTGAVDWLEDDTFYENGWETLESLETRIVELDFSSAIAYDIDPNNPVAVANLNHVTNIGYMVAFRGGDGWEWGTGSGGDVYVQPIPEAASIVIWGLLGVFGIGLAWWRRRR